MDRQAQAQIVSDEERELAERFLDSEEKRRIFPDSARFLTEFPVGLSLTAEPLEAKRVDLIGALEMTEAWGIDDAKTARQALLRTGTLNPHRFIDNILSDTLWLLEIKYRLDQKAVGQVLADKDLLTEDLAKGYYSSKKKININIKMGIIYHETDRLLELTCRNHDITIFVV